MIATSSRDSSYAWLWQPRQAPELPEPRWRSTMQLRAEPPRSQLHAAAASNESSDLGPAVKIDGDSIRLFWANSFDSMSPAYSLQVLQRIIKACGRY